MRRQPTLAEILSDDTGKIRAEVADLLMEPNRQRLRPIQQPRPQHIPRPRPFGMGWIFFALVIFLVVIGLKVFDDSKAHYTAPSKILATEGAAKFPEPAVEVKAVRTGLIIADGVSVRTQPSLQGEVIKEVNRNENLKVISFRDGWYEVSVFNQGSGYVFGAYLIPQNFDFYPYRVAITKKDQTKLLVKEVGDPMNFQVIWPDKPTTWISKNELEMYR